jgi:DNA modification methylase
MARGTTNKKDLIAAEVARAVGAGRAVEVESVDFNDPTRPKTCLEVDFPILPINQVAVIEGNAGKPIYQMSKWWARRRSSVFRSMLIAAATKAPADPSHAAKVVWDNYYANFQRKGSFKHLKVADVFMGGGTTLVEGSRLGMQMFGNDLNPVAWFVVKQEFANVNLDEVKRLLAGIEAEVKPQIMPFYYCDGPNGENGKWIHIPTGRVEEKNFDPLKLSIAQRFEYRYQGPEIIYTFWAKHGPCQVTGCGHRTPIMTNPVVAVKTLTVKYWDHICGKCGGGFHVEDSAARMAPDEPLYVVPGEAPFSVLDPRKGVDCPNCGRTSLVNLGKGKNKKVVLSLLVHPHWLAGSPKQDANGKAFGGSAQDDAVSSARWNQERASKIRFLEVRGELPDEVTCPETKITFKTNVGTVPKKSNYACGACGARQDVLSTVKATGKTGPMAAYAIQGFAPGSARIGDAYNGRFFRAFDARLAHQYDAAFSEWEARKDTDLNGFWPRCELSLGWKTHGWAIPEHGFTHYWTMFNPRQLLVFAQLLKAILETGEHRWETREFVLGAFQQYLRNNNSFSFWNIQADKLEPHFSNNNYHPKALPIENNVFGPVGRGTWVASAEGLTDSLLWASDPWDTVSVVALRRSRPELADECLGKGEKVRVGDPLRGAEIFQGSSTELTQFYDSTIDLVITDPPFGEIMQYAELADFFYVWLRLALKNKYPDIYGGEHSPKSMEAVANPFREPEDPNGFYQRLLTGCWREAFRILKEGGILAFTFHHDKDEAWASVLESLFDAGFFLEATYPIRSDETKGENAQFGSQKIEYDIIHVCRKRIEEPTAVSWGRMRKEVLQDVRQLQHLLENHTKAGLPAADLHVIRRGKALEYFSRHYGKVFVDEGRSISVKDALVGINQLIDEDSSKSVEPIPVIAEPITRQFLRIFDGKIEIPRDQMQKYLRGSGIAPDIFEQRGWCREHAKIFLPVSPLEIAQTWYGKHRRGMTFDYDQAMFLIGACFDGSGINATDTLKNENFRPHPALKALLEWQGKRGSTQAIRNAAIRAHSIYQNWANTHREQVQQLSFFDED